MHVIEKKILRLTRFGSLFMQKIEPGQLSHKFAQDKDLDNNIIKTIKKIEKIRKN